MRSECRSGHGRCFPTEEVGRVTSDHQKKDSVRGVFERAGPQKNTNGSLATLPNEVGRVTSDQKVGRVTSDHLTPNIRIFHDCVPKVVRLQPTFVSHLWHYSFLHINITVQPLETVFGHPATFSIRSGVHRCTTFVVIAQRNVLHRWWSVKLNAGVLVMFRLCFGDVLVMAKGLCANVLVICGRCPCFVFDVFPLCWQCCAAVSECVMMLW